METIEKLTETFCRTFEDSDTAVITSQIRKLIEAWEGRIDPAKASPLEASSLDERDILLVLPVDYPEEGKSGGEQELIQFLEESSSPIRLSVAVNHDFPTARDLPASLNLLHQCLLLGARFGGFFPDEKAAAVQLVQAVLAMTIPGLILAGSPESSEYAPKGEEPVSPILSLSQPGVPALSLSSFSEPSLAGLLPIRCRHASFHPQSSALIMETGPDLFVIIRGGDTICLHNLTDNKKAVSVPLDLVSGETPDSFTDLITGTRCGKVVSPDGSERYAADFDLQVEARGVSHLTVHLEPREVLWLKADR